MPDRCGPAKKKRLHHEVHQEHKEADEEERKVVASSPFETFVSLLVGCSPEVSMKLSKHPQQDAYRVPTLTRLERFLVTFSTVFRPPGTHKSLARIAMMSF